MISWRCGQIFSSRRAVLFGAAAVVAACNGPPKIASFHYSLRIGVRVNGVDRFGESVIKVEWRDTRMPSMPNAGMDFQPRTWGEAVHIDLRPKHGLLFALLRGDRDDSWYPAKLPTKLLGELAGNAYRSAKGIAAFDLLAQVTGAVDVPQKEQPMLVRFRDINDLQSVEGVDRYDLTTTYGADVALSSVTIQTTRADPTFRLGEAAPVLEKFASVRPAMTLSGARVSQPFGPIVDQLTGMDFLHKGE